MAALPARVAVVAELLAERPRISIIIPILNEADCLDQSLAKLFAQPWIGKHCEVIVSDGGSCDGSREIAARYPCKVVTSAAGRALQMNTASRSARGVLLLFLHADSELPADPGVVIPLDAKWGFFNLRLSGGTFVYRVLETAINLRTGVTKVAGGDQALFFNRIFFESIGGYPRIPLMEDVAISKLARTLAAPVRIKSSVTSSSRRWQQQGVVKTILMMWLLRLAFWLGVDPARLHKIYYPQREPDA